MKNIFLIVLAFLANGAAYAHLGETIEECTVRYGKPMEQDAKSAAFRKNGFLIITTFGTDGKCGMIIYRKGGKNALGNYEELSDVELKGILEANSPVWNKLNKTMTNISFTNNDGSAMAVYGLLDHDLQLCTTEWFKQFQAEQANQQKNAVQGL
jgi:hypothetical protein